MRARYIAYAAAAALALGGCESLKSDRNLEGLVSSQPDYCVHNLSERSTDFFFVQKIIGNRCVEYYWNPQADQMTIYTPTGSSEGTWISIIRLNSGTEIEKKEVSIDKESSNPGYPSYNFERDLEISPKESYRILGIFKDYLNLLLGKEVEV